MFLFLNISVITANIILFILVFIKSRKSISNRIFLVLILVMTLWIIVTTLEFLYSFSIYATLLVRIDFSLGALMGLLFFLFTIFYPQRIVNIKNSFIIFITLISLVLFVSALSPLVINDTSSFVNGLSIVEGPMFFVYSIYLIGVSVIGSFILFLKVRKTNGLAQSQTLFSLIGIGGLALVVILFNLILPRIFDPRISDYSIFGFLFFIIIIVFSIIKYRLLNIKFVITKSVVYIFLVSIIAVIFVLVSYVTATFFEKIGVNEYVIWILAAILVVAGMDPLKNLFASLTDRIFYKDKIDYNVVLKSLSNIINEEIELPSLVKHIEENLVNQLKVQDAQLLLGVYGEQIFLPLTDYLAFTPAKRSKNRVAADKHVYYNSALIQYMRKVKIPIVTDEFERYIYDLDDPTKQRKLNKILHDMQGLETGTTAPIIREGKMVALLLIGNKVSGETFSNEDINLLEVLSSQLAAAIERSKLYQEVQDFNLKLQKEVEKATKNLLRANDQLKEANIHLKELDSAKSEFMSIASHQLRTPLAGIVGYLSMILDGDYGKIDASQQKIVSEVFAASQRLVRLVNTFLNVTRIEAGRFTLSFVNVNFVDLVRGEVMELQPTADKKNVKLVYEEPKDKNLMAMVDDKIRDAVLNLIDNAIKYTPDGTVTVRLEKEGKDMLHYSVKDSGVGISKDEVDNLFQKFVRGSGIAKIQPNGSGLGLYIVKKIVEGHGGKVWAESEGEGKGSTFNIRIPIKQSKSEYRAKAEQIFTGKTLI